MSKQEKQGGGEDEFSLPHSATEDMKILLPPPVRWQNWFFWPAEWRFVSFMAIFAGGAHCLKQKWAKRPIYANLPNTLHPIGWGLLFSYLIGKYFRYHMTTRDAVITHYMEQHPQDFQFLNKQHIRTYGDVFAPWMPVRTMQCPPPMEIDKKEGYKSYLPHESWAKLGRMGI